MDSRETIRRLFENKDWQRMGLRDVPWPETAVSWLAQGYPEAPRKYMEDYAGTDRFAEFGIQKYPADAINYFDMDLAKCGFYWDVLPKKGHIEVLEENERWRITRNGAGAVIKTLKVLSGCPEHMAYEMTNRDIWESEFKPYLTAFDESRVNSALMKEKLAQRRAQGRYVYFSTMFVWETLRTCLGDVCLYESIITEPEWIHDICRTYTDFYKEYMDYVFANVGQPDGVLLLEDLAYKGTLFCSPRTYAEVIFPYYAEITEFIHERGMHALLHSCGCVTEALPLIADAGFDLLNPMEVKAGCDLVEYVKAYKDKFVFMGGFDARILESGDLQLIRNEVKKLLMQMKSMGVRYIFGSDHSLSPNVSLQSFRCAVDTYRENMWY